MASVNVALLEAVDRLKKAEIELVEARIEVANLLQRAASTQPITGLSRLTKINRSTVYWLIKTWSNSANSNGNNRRKAS